MSKVGKDIGKMATRMFKPGYQGTQESWVQLAAPSEKEQEYLRRYQTLSEDLASTPNTMELSANDQETLNNAYNSAFVNLRRRGQIYAQDLAGTRGLNTSDTPVSDSVLRELLPATADLESNKASTSLGLGLQLRGLDLQKRQSLINTAMNLANREQQDRYTTARHYGNFTQAANANGMQNASQLFSAMGAGLGLIGSGGTALMGAGGALAGLAGGAGGGGGGYAPMSRSAGQPLTAGLSPNTFQVPSWMNQYR